ncbi:MAG: hypothetical protein IPL28_17195 [Chloroflexi bacterium]|nr:hypothetical protein [Chloroflexota bacterium]
MLPHAPLPHSAGRFVHLVGLGLRFWGGCAPPHGRASPHTLQPIHPQLGGTAQPTSPTHGGAKLGPLPVRDVLAHNGLLWYATGGGLLVWDVARPTTPISAPNTACPATNSPLWRPDAHGRIWVGSAGAGVAQYDGHAWQIFTTTTGLPSDTIHDLLTPAGNCWRARPLALPNSTPPATAGKP